MQTPHRRRRAPRALPVALLGGLAALALGACSEPGPTGPRPDVVLIVIDTLRADRLGAYGYERPTTPVMDRLAREGALFENARAQAPWTLPSMTSMVTGRYVTSHREFPPEDWPLIAEVFQGAGYRTVGASANPLLDDESGFGRGYDDYRFFGPDSPWGSARTMGDVLDRMWQPIDRALETDGDGERPPLFLYVQPFDPHAPYEPHEVFDDALPRGGAPAFRPEGYHRGELEREGLAGPQDDPEWTRAFEKLATLRGRYDQEVRYVDEQLERLLDGLRERGVLDDAVVAIVSDHGEGLWDHRTPGWDPDAGQDEPETFFFQSHGHDLYQAAIGTPFVLWGPRVPAGVRIDDPVENVDLFATLMQVADLAPPAGLDGRSLVGLLEGEPQEWRRYAYAFVRHIMSVYDHETGLKLVTPTAFGKKRGLADELYHLPSDPLEMNDLAAERPEEVARLGEVLGAWVAANPTESTVGAKKSKRQRELMSELGYAGIADEDEDEEE